MRSISTGLGIVMCLIVFVGCRDDTKATPARPAKVPAAAVWVGGEDGGAWVLCERKEGSLYCRVFNEWTGGLEANSAVVLESTGFPVTETPAEMTAWDGDRILLRNGDALRFLENP